MPLPLTPDDILTEEILNEIQDNLSFRHQLLACASNPELVKEFNRLSHTNLKFDAAVNTSGILGAIDQATGFNGIIAEEKDLRLFIHFVYEGIYLKMLNLYGKEALEEIIIPKDKAQ